METEPERSDEAPEGKTVYLLPSQWAWLTRRGQRSQSRSASAEVRALVAAEMEREAEPEAKAA